MEEYSPLKYSVKYRRKGGKMVHKMWRQDFKCAEFGLNYHTPEHFTRCFYQKEEKVKTWWIIYRSTLAVYFVTTWIISFLSLGRTITQDDQNKYFIFVTNWSYTLETLHFVLAAVVVIIQAIRERRKSFQAGNSQMVFMPVYHKIYWIMQTILLPVSVAVSGIFWAAVYDPEINPLDVINFSTHVFNSLLMIIDFLLSGQPYRVLHFYWPVLYCFVYLIFSLIYYALGGEGTDGRKPIYAILDWSRPEATVLTCTLTLIFVIFLHITFWLLHKLKKYCKAKIEERRRSRYKEGQENLGMDETIAKENIV